MQYKKNSCIAVVLHLCGPLYTVWNPTESQRLCQLELKLNFFILTTTAPCRQLRRQAKICQFSADYYHQAPILCSNAREALQKAVVPQQFGFVFGDSYVKHPPVGVIEQFSGSAAVSEPRSPRETVKF